MDLKKFSTSLMISALVMLALMYIKPDWFGGKAALPPAQPSGIVQAPAPVLPGAAAPTNQPPTLSAGTQGAALPIAAPQTLTLGSAAHGAHYKLELVVNNVRASVQRVQLCVDDYAATVKKQQPLLLLQADERALAPFATTEVRINGLRFPLLDAPSGAPLTWYVDKEHTTDTQATLYVILYTDSTLKTPWVRVEKVFQIDPKSYDVTINHHVQNLTGQAINVQVDQMGPSNLWNKPPDDYRTDSRTYQTAVYDKDKQYLFTDGGGVKLVYQTALAKPTSKAEDLGSFQGNQRMVWLAASNRFFTAIVRPMAPAGAAADPLRDGRGIPQADFVQSAQALPLYYDTLPTNSITGVQIFGKPVLVAANGSRDLPLNVYLGPKKREILDGSATAPAGSDAYTYNLYGYTGVIQITRGSCSFMTFPMVAWAILDGLNFIHRFTLGNWGVAIIILVIFVRLLLHPLTRSSQVNMAKMQHKMAEIQPELERIKRKYPKDNAKQQQEKMAVFKEHKINPAGSVLGCLPMLLQMPIWAALYSGLAIDIDLRHAGFIPGWITDLSNPDTLFAHVDGPYVTLPLLGPVYGLNLLPLLLALVFFVQMRYSMKNAPKPADEQQAQTQKISQYMFLLFPVMLYNAPSGLNLYIFASSIGGFFDTWLIRRHMKEKGLLPAQMGPTL